VAPRRCYASLVFRVGGLTSHSKGSTVPRNKRLSPRKQPTQQRSRETVAAILDAAAQVFESQGYEAGTTDRIAERAGVSVGSLYQYFPSKDVILVALAARHIERAASLVESMVQAAQSEAVPLGDLLERLVHAVIHEHSDGANLHRVLFEHGPMPAALGAYLRDADAKIEARVAELLRVSPEVTVGDVDCAAFLVVHVVDGIVHRFLLHPPDRVPMDAFVRHVVDMILRFVTGPR
jgi:AcrR family transcriptional regulator